jgi:LysM repeat protein
MSERGLPVVDGAPACPFVAFDDDRDGRSTAPDHRHRCFAEPNPAPRALAHQDAYCLSPAFAVCPAFQDWARREAAAARQTKAAAPAAPPARVHYDPAPVAPAGGLFYSDEPSAAYDEDRADAGYDDDGTPDHDAYARPAADEEAWHQTVDPAGVSPRRPAAREWAAPPPWVDEDHGSQAAPPAPASTAPGAIPGWGSGAAGVAGAAGAARAAATDRPRGRDEAWGGSARGLAGSAADRLAGPDPDAPKAARPQRSYAPPTADDLDDEGRAPAAHAEAAAPVPVTPRRPGAAVPPRSASSAGSRALSDRRPVPADRRPDPRDGARDGSRAPGPRDPGELFGPAWEKPRRYEAYPSLRTRVGLPSFAGLPRVGVAALALVAAAVFLFIVGPMLLGLGSKSPGTAVSSASPSASAQPSAAATTTVAPAPTPHVYVVVANDTLTKIATRFGVTLKALKAANPQIKNQNAIAIGDRLTIPVPAGTTGGTGGTVGGASPSASP